MAMTVSPSPVAFGDVATGTTSSIEVTITVGASDLAVTAIAVSGTSFSKLSGVSSVAVDSNGKVTLQFAPSAVGDYTGTLTLTLSDNSTSVVSLSGYGYEVTNDAGSGYDEVTYQHDNSNATAVLLKVEDFNNAGNSPSDAVGQYDPWKINLGSYLRLGAVPDSIYETYNAGGNYLGNIDNNGEDLASHVLDFVDDTRYRGSSADRLYRLSNGQRSTESGKLHTRGGWRDHTDGNRITTTRGDKVEVIGGHEKLIVMGRKQWKGGSDASDASLHWESSGGISYHYDQIPGQIVDVRWVTDEDGTMRVIEECQKGHFVARYEGEVRDWKYGPEIEERIGSKPAYTHAVNNRPAPATPSSSDAYCSTNSPLGFPADSDFDKSTDSDSSVQSDTDEDHNVDMAWPPASATVPDIVEITWANTITCHEWARVIADYTGSKNRRVKSITEEVYAVYIEDYDYAGTVTETVHFTTKLKEVLIAKPGARLVEQRIGRYKGGFDGHAGEYWGFGLSEEFSATNFFETFWGGFESMRFGFSLNTFTGFEFDLHIFPLTMDIYMMASQLDLLFLTWHIDVYSTASSHFKYGIIKDSPALYQFGTGVASFHKDMVKTHGPMGGPFVTLVAIGGPLAVLGVMFAKLTEWMENTF